MSASNSVTVVNVTEQAGAAPGESVKTEVFRSEEADGSIVTKTVRTTRRTVTSSTGALVTTIEVETTTETEATDGTKSTTVAAETHEETETEESSLTTTSASDAQSVRSNTTIMKSKKTSKKGGADSGSASSLATRETEQRRAAAAWGEEGGNRRAISAESHRSKNMNELLIRRGYSVRLAFEDLTCTAQVGEISTESIDVVKGAIGYAEPGTLTAVVGADRAGKAAFLGALAGEGCETKGRVFYNGHEASALVRRRATGYCWYGDEHAVWHGTHTVREALSLSASLRQGDEISESRKLEVVDACLELLEITGLAEQQIDSCSTVEARLVSIGVELAFAPSVVLLDEPTSGLDSTSAQRIVRALQQVAHTGRTVVCTLGDATSSTELHACDRLLLLSSSGETIYHGESRRLVQYLEALPGVKRLSSGKSITAWALESVGGGSTAAHSSVTTTTTTTTRGGRVRTSTKKKKYASAASMSTSSDAGNREKETRFVQLFQRSEVRRTLLTQMQRVGFLRADSAEENVPALIAAYERGKLSGYAASWRTQMTWLTRRVVLSYWRSLSAVVTILSLQKSAAASTRVGVAFLAVLTVCFLWLLLASRGTEYDTFDGVNQGVSFVAWSALALGAIFALGAITRVSRGNAWRENACWRREQAWQAYPAVAYHVCSSAVELVCVLAITFVAAVLTFTLSGFWSVAEGGSFSLYWFVLSIFALGQIYLGQWLVRMLPSASVAAAASAGLNLLPMLLFVRSWRSSALGSLIHLLMLLTPQRLALQVLPALVFGVSADTCVDDTTEAERELPCRELRLVPSDFGEAAEQLTVHSYAELEFGADRGSVALRLVELVVFLVVSRFLVVVALHKRRAQS
jgi:ABC-type multidrug transport system ATPase subunit